MKKEKKEIHLKDKKLIGKQRRDEEKTKLPVQNMAYKDDPPAFITIVGSKNSGKSTLLKSMIKKLCKNTIETVNGPITCTISKDKRATFFECKSDIHQFVDTAKVSDLVIFVIDARVGLEMECFEYLNLLMSHGLPKLLFVLTHCEKKNNQEMFKKIKKRIWNEVCEGLKFFYLGLENNKYTENEFLNLIRAIKGMKYRPIEWKCTHSHIIVDNIDDNFAYGYVRGTCMRKNTDIHIPGYGDNKILDFEIMEDPVSIKNEGRLSSRRDLLHAPMSYNTKDEVEESSITSNEIDFNLTNNMRLFKRSDEITKFEEESSTIEEADLVESISPVETIEEIKEEQQQLSFDNLKEIVKGKFRKAAETEEEWTDKFNKKYKEKTVNNEENIFIQKRNEIINLKEKNIENKSKDVALPGEYIKITLQKRLNCTPDFTKIIILGSLNISENTETVLQGKFKKNKWHKKLLKTNEPYIFSLGWRRFQSIPVFSSKTPEINRMLKYSFQHGFSAINFYGRIVQPGAGFAIYSETGDFRVLGGGNIMDVTGNHNLVKKLKLVGYPKTITGNTVVVTNMFTSDLEVLKFRYGKLKTASGLKGAIKNPIGKKGDFRGSFEGEMLMSDIVVLKCYVDFPIYKHIIPVNNLYEDWQGLRCLKDIRKEFGIEVRDKYNEESGEKSMIETDEEENCVEDKEFSLPIDIEKELPLEHRKVRIIDETIKLPVPPGEREKVEQIQLLESLRKENEKSKQIKLETENKVKEKEYEEFLKEKNEKKKKKIVESALNKQKRIKGFKGKKK